MLSTLRGFGSGMDRGEGTIYSRGWKGLGVPPSHLFSSSNGGGNLISEKDSFDPRVTHSGSIVNF